MSIMQITRKNHRHANSVSDKAKNAQRGKYYMIISSLISLRNTLCQWKRNLAQTTKLHYLSYKFLITALEVFTFNHLTLHELKNKVKLENLDIYAPKLASNRYNISNMICYFCVTCMFECHLMFVTEVPVLFRAY